MAKAWGDYPTGDRGGKLIVTVRQVSQDDAFYGLEIPWRDLERHAANDNPFLTFEWLAAWWRHFGRRGRLCILVAEREG